MPKVHGKRALLNGPGHETTAAIVAEIEDTSSWESGRNGDGQIIERNWDAEPTCVLQFSNCDRSIAFDISMRTADDRKNTLKKVDTMIGALTQFRAGLAVEFALYEKRIRGLKK